MQSFTVIQIDYIIKPQAHTYLHRCFGTHGHRWLDSSVLERFLYLRGMLEVCGCSDCLQYWSYDLTNRSSHAFHREDDRFPPSFWTPRCRLVDWGCDGDVSLLVVRRSTIRVVLPQWTKKKKMRTTAVTDNSRMTADETRSEFTIILWWHNTAKGWWNLLVHSLQTASSPGH